MKHYNERLPLIDAAIDEFNGKWPDSKYKSLCAAGRLNTIYKKGTLKATDTTGHADLNSYWMHICTRAEFNQRAKELGYVNGYKYGVEYETNGEKPDLPDDVKLYINFMGDGMYITSGEITLWGGVKSFRIVDERYKPKEQDMNDWYEKGEMPPVGTKCEYRKNPDEWLVGKIFGHRIDSQGNLSAYINLNDGKNWDYSSQVDKFQPLRTETDKLVEQVFQVIYDKDDYRTAAEELVKQGYRKIKPMSRNDFFTHVVDEFGIDSVTAFEMYRKGCRFLDQGE